MKQYIQQWGLEFLGIIVTFFVSIQWAVLYCFFLILFDLFTGIYAAKKRREKLTSKKASDSVGKFLIYVGALVVARASMETFYIEFDLVRVVLTGIALVELKSIDENIEKYLGYSLLGKLIGFFKRDAKSIKS